MTAYFLTPKGVPLMCPTYALPQSMQSLVYEFQKNLAVDSGMVISTLVASIAGCAQAAYEIERFPGTRSPLSAMFWIISESGSGKTPTEERMNGEIRKFEEECRTAYSAEFEQYETRMQAFLAERKGVLRAIRKAAANGEATNADSQRLAALDSLKPTPPRLYRLLYNSISVAGVQDGLSKNIPSAFVSLDEASDFLNGKSLDEVRSLLISTWSGGGVFVDRHRRQIHLKRADITGLFMVQPKAFERHLARSGEKARDEGLYARALFVSPPSNRGAHRILNTNSSWPELEKHNFKIRRLLEKGAARIRNDEACELLTFSDDARYGYRRYFNDVQQQMTPGAGGWLETVPDYAAKMADNVARLAGLFHVYDDLPGPISVETLNQAIEIVGWYSMEFIKIFVPPPPMPQEQVDAQQLYGWLANYVRTHCGMMSILKRDLRRSGPNSLRNTIRLNAALVVLWQRGILNQCRDQVGKSTYIYLNQQFFTPEIINQLSMGGAGRF